jgi:hypothetical protein
MFWRSEPVLLDIRNEIPDLVDEEDGDPEKACYADGNKGQACFANVEAIEGRVLGFECD